MARRTLTSLWIVITLFGGCGHLRLERPLRPQQGDWAMYGGVVGRMNSSSDTLRPPLKISWEYEAGSGFCSSPLLLIDDLLFISTLSGELLIVDAATGKEKGSRDFGSAIIGSPVVDGNLLYVVLGYEDESVVCYDLTKGRISWSVRAGDIESSPLILGNRLVVATLKGKVLCYEKTTGNTLWKFEVPSHVRPAKIHSSPASD